MMDSMGSGMGSYFFPGFGIVLQLGILIVVLLVVYWVINTGKLNSGTPEEILKKRLAKGEITKKEYNEIKKEISK